MFGFGLAGCHLSSRVPRRPDGDRQHGHWGSYIFPNRVWFARDRGPVHRTGGATSRPARLVGCRLQCVRPAAGAPAAFD
jgi:hypothetical protein